MQKNSFWTEQRGSAVNKPCLLRLVINRWKIRTTPTSYIRAKKKQQFIRSNMFIANLLHKLQFIK